MTHNKLRKVNDEIVFFRDYHILHKSLRDDLKKIVITYSYQYNVTESRFIKDFMMLIMRINSITDYESFENYVIIDL